MCQRSYESYLADYSAIRRIRTEQAARSKGRETMKLHAPAMWIFVVALIIAIVAVVGMFTPIPYITLYGFWVAILAFVVLVLGNILDI